MTNISMTSLISIFLVSLVVMAMAVFAVPVTVNAQAEAACQGAGGRIVEDPDTGRSTCRLPGGQTNLFGTGSLFERIINILLFLVGAAAVVMMIVGGIRYVISAGDSNAAQAAKNTILYAIIGLVIAVLAYAFVNFIVGALI